MSNNRGTHIQITLEVIIKHTIESVAAPKTSGVLCVDSTVVLETLGWSGVGHSNDACRQATVGLLSCKINTILPLWEQTAHKEYSRQLNGLPVTTISSCLLFVCLLAGSFSHGPITWLIKPDNKKKLADHGLMVSCWIMSSQTFHLKMLLMWSLRLKLPQDQTSFFVLPSYIYISL